MVPNKQKCYQLLKKYNFPKRKYRHVELVAKVARYLVNKLKAKNPKLKVDAEMVEMAALLHDIDKGIRGAGKYHPKVAVEVLRKEGYGRIAEWVAKHSLPAILDEKLRPNTWEEKLLFLADKMVKDEVIGVDERFRLWRQENVEELNKLLDKTYPLVKKLEQEVFTRLGVDFQDIYSQVVKKDDP